MPEKIVEHVTQITEIFMYALAAVAGGLGGCMAASNQLFQGRALRWSILMAYIICGMAMGLLIIAYTSVFFGEIGAVDKIIGHSILAGLAGSTLLAGGHISVRWVLKKLGVEITLTARRKDEDRRNKK